MALESHEDNGSKRKRKPPIDIEDFNLGGGLNKDKIARLHGLINCLIDDVDLLKKFNKQRQVSKNKIIKYHSHVKSCSGHHMNPNLKVIEDVFVPVGEPNEDNYCPENNLEQNIFRKSELSSAGIFVQRNQIIAPYFKEYS